MYLLSTSVIAAPVILYECKLHVTPFRDMKLIEFRGPAGRILYLLQYKKKNNFNTNVASVPTFPLHPFPPAQLTPTLSIPQGLEFRRSTQPFESPC